jgi:peptidoglycan/LPS O-acetylase OafA/YrhL
MRPKRLYELDVLRGLAAFGVMLYHYTFRFEALYGQTGHSSGAVWDIFRHFAFGLPMFFVISGFVILMTLDRTERASDFLYARFNRLFPAFWAAIAVTFAITHLFGLPGRTVSFPTALINMTMAANAFNVPYVDGVYWTLALELAFYGIMWALFVTRGLEQVERAVAIWLGAHLMAVAAFRLTGRAIPHSLELALLMGRAQYFIAGVLFFRAFKLGWDRTRLLLLAGCCVTQAVAGPTLEDTLVFGALMGLFGLLVSGRLSWIVQRPLVFLGAISYSLYLLHQNIGYVLLRGLYAHGAPVPLALLATIAVIMALAAGLHFAVERPVMAWARRTKERRRLEGLRQAAHNLG